MPRPARSPTPTRPQGVVVPAFRGARRGAIRWKADLGPGRHEIDRKTFGPWYHVPPEQPLVRADGVVITDWHGVVRAHGPDGTPLWERDVAVEPGKAWAEFWGRLLCVDESNGVWLETRAGLHRLSPDGEPTLVNPDRQAGGFAPGVGRPLAWGGFVRSYGTDEHYWTGHWPCCESVVELLDGEGRVSAAHAMGWAPGRVHVVGRRIVALFYDASHDPPEHDEALVLDEDGAIVGRRVRAAGDDADAWRRGLLADVATEQGLAAAFAAPGRAWYEGPAVPVPGGERAYAVSPAWNETIRLLRLGPDGSCAEALRDVSADPPTVDIDGVCYATRVRRNELRLAGLGVEGPVLDVALLDGPELRRYAFPHGGRPAKVWAATRWFHSPTALGPDGTTLVLTNLGEGCALYCVE